MIRLRGYLHEEAPEPAADEITPRLVIASARPPYTMLFKISTLRPSTTGVSNGSARVTGIGTGRDDRIGVRRPFFGGFFLSSLAIFCCVDTGRDDRIGVRRPFFGGSWVSNPFAPQCHLRTKG
ncbi:hypothetical protein Bca52824_070127 [Brassica carinata]|uniref:Uncharacterized protein n=1 Tax=Brassica carinata TaxID=52824 RepID=A0A8X7Q4T9_BRACI|nr:hypothetical protein Bca52824_070127 [Brassica carinata]